MNKHKKTFISSLTGTIIVLICCFTPVLVILFGAIGLSLLVPYLDFVLFPALGLLIILTVMSYIDWRKSV
jgi:mercuric ion transport protein